MHFRDRTHAGRMLAERLRPYGDEGNLLVLGLPRGGVPVASEIACTLGAPLDVFVVRKLGLPGQEEVAMGAIASGGVGVLNHEVVQALGIDEEAIARAAAAESAALERRERIYRGERGPIEVGGRTVILVDDGIATGTTMRAATRALGSQNPERLLVAVPVAAEETCEEFRSEADEVVCAVTPESVSAVSLWYEDFTPIADEEVGELLARSEHGLPR